MRTQHAFTIPEMLAVIAIIFILFVMLVGFPQPSREHARRMVCLNNLKQIGVAGAQYATDYAGRLPCGQSSVFWNVALMSNTLVSTKVLVCPSSSKMAATSFSDPQATDAANVSYTQQAGLTTGMIWRANAGAVLFWDQSVGGNPCGPTGNVGLSWTNAGNHKAAGGNVLFNDGHAAWHITTPTNMPLGCLNP